MKYNLLSDFRCENHFLLLLNKLRFMKFRLTLYILLISFGPGIFAQYYDTGQDPASLKWMQIKTNRFTVIYPESYGIEGVKYAKSLDDSYAKLSRLYPSKKFRIPVVIHNYTTFSNGYVAWAPKRMEIYPTPEQNGIPLDPVEQLTTHELTHVLQMVSLNKGFTRVMSVLSGEQFTGVVSALLPLWFMEGDAVFAESLLSPSGRGKTPAFQKQLKAILLEKPRMYSYDKILAGSFRNSIPDHYQYGYQMVTWSFAKYGPELWNKALDYTAKNPFTIVPVNLSLRKNAGLTKEKLYLQTFDSLKTLWQREESKIMPVKYESLNPPKKNNYINYYSPAIIGKDSVIAIKTSFRSIPEFVLINPGKKSEKRIHIPGSMYPYFISYSNGKIVWVENKPDPRWENRTWSVIKIMDVAGKITTQLTFKTRYLAAAISEDGRFIAAVENTISNVNSLIIIDAFTGEILDKIPVPGNAYPQRPQWSETGKEILIIFLSENGEGIMSYSLNDRSWNTLLDAGRNDLQAAVLRNDSLFFVSSSSGTDNLYILAPDKSISKLTNSAFGAYDPFVSGGDIIFSDYSSTGYNISKVSISEAAAYSPAKAKDPSFLINRFDTIKIKETDKSLAGYTPRPYRKMGHLFGFHSWMPFYADIEKIQADPTSVRPGLTLMSQNQLSTVTSSIGYEYAADRTNQIHSRVTLKGWLPVFESQLDYGGKADIFKKATDPGPSVLYPALRFTGTVYIPLSFSTGKFSQYFQPSLSSSYLNRYIFQGTTYDYGQTQLTGRLYFSNYRLTSMRDIYPRWAQVIDYFYTWYPFDKAIYGNVSTLRTAFYFPGLIRNHSLKIRLEYEVQNPAKYILQNRASFPRSYTNIISQKLKFYSADYTMPLLYPDLNIPGTIYIKRIRTSVFYDYARGSKNLYVIPNHFHNFTETFNSFGGSLMADFFILRIPFMISAGVQTTWKTINSPPLFELLFNIDVFGNKIGRRKL
jgi:hypothetical protein